MTGALLVMWTVYDHPKDAPDCFVARKWEVTAAGAVATPQAINFDTLEDARKHMRQSGLTRMSRDPQDDPVILEVWL